MIFTTHGHIHTHLPRPTPLAGVDGLTFTTHGFALNSEQWREAENLGASRSESHAFHAGKRHGDAMDAGHRRSESHAFHAGKRHGDAGSAMERPFAERKATMPRRSND